MMKRQVSLALLLMASVFSSIPFTVFLQASAVSSGVRVVTPMLARLGERVILKDEGRGAPIISLENGREALTAYVGDTEAQWLLDQNLVQPVAIASSDFDGDGVPDLVSGYAAPDGGLLTLHRGNIDSIHPNGFEAQQRKAAGTFTESPFLSPALALNTPRPVDLIGCGDFDADGSWDVVTAARGDDSLYIFRGDGHGNLGAPRKEGLPGRITALVAGEINRRNGSSSIAIAVTGAAGSRLLVFDSLRRIGTPVTIALPAKASALVPGRFSDNSDLEIAVAASNTLLIVRVGGAAANERPRILKRSFPFYIKALAAGDFTGNHRTDLSLLTGDREVHVLTRPSAVTKSPGRLKEWSSVPVSLKQFSRGAKLISARLSSFSRDTVVVVDPPAHRLTLLTSATATPGQSYASTHETTLDAESEPVAVLPMRLNSDALSDLVVLTRGRTAPTAVLTAPVSIFTVTNTNDSGLGSLRDAIDQANMSPGNDLINFSAGLGTINVGSSTALPLPGITETLTIDGGSPRVELNGTAAVGEPANGLSILAPNVTVQGLVINGFSGAGISLQSIGIVQDNFIGTNTAGTSALPNASGVLIEGIGNSIGGTSPGSRNVISGNSGVGIELNGAMVFDNIIEGNFIGTDASGSNALGNGTGGIVILGATDETTIGGTTPGAGNTIAFNGISGIAVFGGTSNAILGNSIFSNSSLGIDLEDEAVTLNDPCDVDAGANNLQNFPTLTSVTSAGMTTTILGSLDSAALGTYRVEFFSNSTCDASGFGQGRTFIGSVIVNTDAMCFGPINVVLPVAVAPGGIVTATATDESNNTSEFSQCVAVPGGGCTVVCPPDLIVSASSTSPSCGTVVTFSPAVFGCEEVTCVPPSGSVFDVGTTSVSCSEIEGPSCSFNVTVVDDTPPSLNCSGVTVPLPAGQSFAVVDYPAPIVSDCSSASVVCAPPSGSTFPAGATLITCTASDAFENISRCFFFVSVVDAEPPVITCPADVSVLPPSGQTSAVVTYPPPTVSDNVPGTNIVCSPASGSSFPVGSTTVTCTATDAGGNRSSCTFIVGVGKPQAKVTLPGNKPAIEFAATARRKPPKPNKNPCTFFTIANIGFSPLVLTFDSLKRSGSDVTNGRISDPNDVNGVAEIAPLKFFSLYLEHFDQSLTQLGPGSSVTVRPGQAQPFCLKFAPFIPRLASKTTGLAASDVLPDLVTSTIVFRQNSGANIDIPILASVATGVVLVNPENPRKPAIVNFARAGNEITVSYAVFDSNLDVTRARYEFLDGSAQVVAGPFDIDLAASISSANLVRGQTFSVEQRFTGAGSNPGITGVRVTVSDGETSASAPSSSFANLINAASVQLMNSTRHVSLYPPIVTLK